MTGPQRLMGVGTMPSHCRCIVRRDYPGKSRVYHGGFESRFCSLAHHSTFSITAFLRPFASSIRWLRPSATATQPPTVFSDGGGTSCTSARSDGPMIELQSRAVLR